MSPTVQKSHPVARFALVLLTMLTAPLVARAESMIPRPEGIQSDVNFWIRVYT